MSFPRQFFARHISTQDSLVRLLMLSLLLVQQGCTTPSLKQWGPWSPHVAEDVRASIRTIGVAVAQELTNQIPDFRGPRVTVEFPSEGARRTAWKWSENWVKAADRVGGHPDVLTTSTGVAMLVVTPVVAAAGAVAGAIEAPSAEEHEAMEASFRGVLDIGDLIHRLQNHVLTHVTERTDLSVATLLRTTNDPLGDRETVPASGVSQPDAMLRIRVQSIDLQGTSDIDPLLALHLDVQATLVAPSAATPLYTHTFHYVTGARRFTEWTADDAQVFRETVDLSLARLAELMVDDLFLTHPFIHEHLGGRHGS